MSLNKGKVDGSKFDLDEENATVLEDAELAAELEDDVLEPIVEEVVTEEVTVTVGVQEEEPASKKPIAASADQGNDVAVRWSKEGNMDDLDFGYGAFPIVSLKTTGEFRSSEGWELGTKFHCVILSWSKKFIVKNGGKDDDEDFAYTYDKETTTTGIPIADLLEKWASDGFDKPEWKKYMDVPAQIVGGHYDGELVILSLPPSAITRFSGHVAKARMQMGKPINQVVTEVSRGDLVTKGRSEFFPWNFNFKK